MSDEFSTRHRGAAAKRTVPERLGQRNRCAEAGTPRLNCAPHEFVGTA